MTMIVITIKGGSRRWGKNYKVLLMMKGGGDCDGGGRAAVAATVAAVITIIFIELFLTRATFYGMINARNMLKCGVS